MAGGHAEPRDPPVLGSLTTPAPRDQSLHYGEESARWYDAINSWRTEDIPFYLRQAEAWAGAGGAVLELAAGQGRVALPMARAGFRVTALESAPPMVHAMERRLSAEDAVVAGRVEVREGDMRRFALDRLYRFIYLPFNTFLILSQPHEQQAMLNCVREHLAPSGAFAFDVFTPDPVKLSEPPAWVMELDFEVTDKEFGKVRVQRERRPEIDLGRQVRHLAFRNRVVGPGGTELAYWEDALDLALVFPRELDLVLERQGFRVKSRHGGPGGEIYAPTPADVQPMYVVAQLVP